MRFLESGNAANKKILMIHGANIPWQMWDTQIAYFSKQYRVIVPALDGHDSESKTDFISVGQSAQEIEAYYIHTYGTEVFAMIGMSMGAAIVWDIVVSGKLHAEKLIFDSGVFVRANPLVSRINLKMLIKMNRNAKLRDAKALKSLENMYGKRLLAHYLEMADSMGEQSLANAVKSMGKYQLPPKLNVKGMDIAAFLGTNFMEIMAKKSVRYLRKNYPDSYIKVFNGYRHGELSVNHPEEFIAEAEKFIQR